MTRRSKTKRASKVPTAPDAYNPDRARRPATRTRPRSDLSRSTARFRPIAPAPLPLSVGPFSALPQVFFTGPARPVPRIAPWTSHGTLASCCVTQASRFANSLLRHRGQRHVRAAARGRQTARPQRRATPVDLPGRCRDRTPNDTANGRHRGGNDTFPERQRHPARGPTTTTCCRRPSRAIARLPSMLQMLTRSGPRASATCLYGGGGRSGRCSWVP